MSKKKLEYRSIPAERLVMLARNPQYVSPKTMESLRRSIDRDGFLAPIVVRPLSGGRYEVISGNHRFLAAKDGGATEIPCVVARISDREAKRIAINLNTIHGNPEPQLMAPFLAELDDATLAEIHLDAALVTSISEFDAELAASLSRLEIPASIDRDSPKHKNEVCQCPTCGRQHFRP